MPDVNGFGQAVMGNAGAVSVDGLVLAERGTCAQWKDDATVIAQVADIGWKVAQRRFVNGAWTAWEVLDDRNCNFLAAKGGLWQAYRSGATMPTLACFGSYGELAPLCNLGQIGTDGRGAAGPDGTINIPIEPNTIRLVSPHGVTADVPGVIARDVQVLGAGRAIWRDDAGQIGVVGIWKPPQPGPIGRPRWVETDIGPYVVAWFDGFGLVAYPAHDAASGHVITSGEAHFHEAVWRDGRLMVRYSTGIGELPHEIARHDDVLSLPVVDFVAPSEPIVPIGRSLWMAWHTGTPSSTSGWQTGADPKSVPGNAYTAILGHPAPHAIVYDFHDVPIAVYTEGRPDSDPVAVEAAVQDARVQHPGLPVICYWPRSCWGATTSAEYPGVEAYRGANESIETFRATVTDGVRRAPQPFIIAQCFSSNGGLTQDLASIPPVVSQIARDNPHVAGLLIFNGTGRRTGLQDHPEVRPAWEQVFAGIPGPPSGGGGGTVEPPGVVNGVLVDPEAYWAGVIVAGENVANYIEVYARKAPEWFKYKQAYQNRSNCQHSSRLFMTHAGCLDVSPDPNNPHEMCLGVKQVPEAWELHVDTVENHPGTTTPWRWRWHNQQGPPYAPPAAVDPPEPQPGPNGILIHHCDPVAQRSNPAGHLVRYEVLAGAAVTKLELKLIEDHEPAVEVLFSDKPQQDGRYIRGVAWKPVRNGSYRLRLRAWDVAGTVYENADPKPEVTVTE